MQIRYGELSNKRDSKLYEDREPPITQMADLLILTTLDALNHLHKILKVPNGNTVNLLKCRSGCNVAAASAFVSQTKRFPTYIVPSLSAGELKAVKNLPSLKI